MSVRVAHLLSVMRSHMSLMNYTVKHNENILAKVTKVGMNLY